MSGRELSGSKTKFVSDFGCSWPNFYGYFEAVLADFLMIMIFNFCKSDSSHVLEGRMTGKVAIGIYIIGVGL